MSVRAALVDCVVLSLQDACVFYPCCKDCLSKIQVELQDAKRCRCAKCGYICLRENVDHRYRLSLKVIRDKCIFGVTVFGTSLNTFFGIPASGLQRLVEDADGPAEASNRCTLLVKAVQDCFIGRHFIFGIKVTETEREPWLRQTNCSRNEDTVQLIASQMILPKALGLGGCTVVSYYRILLQKAAEHEVGSADLRKPSRNPETPLLLPHHSPASSFNSASPSTSGLLSQPLQRSQHQDCTLTPTPPWQQSLGLVTSSAEQEEGCSIQESGDVKSRQTEKNKTQNYHHTQRDNPKNPKVTEERGVSPLLPLQCSSCSTQSFSKYSFASVDEAVGNTSITEPWFSLSPSDNNSYRKKRLSPRKLTQTYLSDSLAWEDLPLSESLTQFLGGENKDFIIADESKPDLNVENRKEISRNNLQDKSQDKNFSTESSFKDIRNSHSQIFLGTKDTPAPNRFDLSDQVCKKPAGVFNRSQTKNKCRREDEKSFSASFESTEEEQLQGDTYDCSADLFSSSLMTDMSTNTLQTQVETVRTTTEDCVLLSVPNKQHLRREMTNSTHLTPDKQKVKSNKCTNEDHLIQSCTFDLDFVPPSQSTPIVKVTALTVSPDCSYRTSTYDESTSQTHSQDSSSCSSKKTAKIPSSKTKCVGLNQRPWCCKESTKENLLWSTKLNRHRLNSKRRFWKRKKNLLAQEPQSVQRGAPNTGTPGRQKHTCDSGHFDVTVCDNDDNNALFVPPTPAVKTRLSVKLRERSHTECSSSDLGWIREEQQRDGVNCQSSVLDQTDKSSRRGVTHAGTSDTETFEEATLDGSNCYHVDGENEACDWSRDLFSDSV